MGDTFDRVLQNILPLDYMEKAVMIYDYELRLIKNRNKGQPEYIFFIKQQILEDESMGA